MHVDVRMLRSPWGKCKNQSIGVYILHQHLPLDITKEIIEMLENLRLIATLSNKREGSTEIHHFQFQPNGLKQVSILFLSAGTAVSSFIT